MTHFAPIPRVVPHSSYVSITMRLSDASEDSLVRHIRLLRDSVALAQVRWGFGIEAAVVLPNELQLLCSFPDPEFGVRGAIQLIGSAFARHLPDGQECTPSAIWAESTEIVEITAPVVSLRKSFIEAAPVRAGFVKHPQDWPYSSANKLTAQAGDMGVAVA